MNEKHEINQINEKKITTDEDKCQIEKETRQITCF